MTTGHCLCGTVKCSYEGEPKWTLNCHCESCRRATGAPAVPWGTFALGSVRLTRGELAEYRSSAAVTRGFCARCGSPQFTAGAG